MARSQQRKIRLVSVHRPAHYFLSGPQQGRLNPKYACFGMLLSDASGHGGPFGNLTRLSHLATVISGHIQMPHNHSLQTPGSMHSEVRL